MYLSDTKPAAAAGADSMKKEITWKKENLICLFE